MSFFVSTSDDGVPSWKGFTFIIPTVSVGNVAQLASDLLISTLGMRKAGLIQDDALTPVVGPDPFALSAKDKAKTKAKTAATPEVGPESSLMTSCEVFESRVHGLVLLQHRAPLIRGRKNAFISRLMAFVKERGFSEVVILCGSHAHERVDTQLGGDQRRFVATTAFADTPKAGRLGTPPFIPLERRPTGETGEDVHPYLPGGGVAKRIFSACQRDNLPALLLTIFCSEGDNIPEAFSLADLVKEVSAWSSSDAPPQWLVPSSWSALFGNPARDLDLVFG